MGQKVHPFAFRIMNGRSWKSNWFSTKKNFPKLLAQDISIKKIVKDRLVNGGIADVMVERYSGQVIVRVFTSKPGMVIGREGSAIDELKEILKTKLQMRDLEVKVEEIRKPEVCANLHQHAPAADRQRRVPSARHDRAPLGGIGAKLFVPPQRCPRRVRHQSGVHLGGAARLVLVVDQDTGVVVEPDVRSVLAANLLAGPHHDGLAFLFFLHRAAGDGILDGADDNVADTRVTAPCSTKDTKALDPLGPGVIGDN